MAPAYTVISILGPPGAGKGTQYKLLCEKLDMIHLSLGDVLRAELRHPESKVADTIRENMALGRVGAKEITVPLLRTAMEKVAADAEKPGEAVFLISPEARQAEFFEETVASPIAILVLECEEEVIKARLKQRAIEEGRFDDDDETIERRLATFYGETGVVLEHYQARGKVYRVDGGGSREEVAERLGGVVIEVLKGQTGAGDLSLQD
ncbi:bifunctional uridylate/adenylate kinase [Knufia fluminis]|uniref:Bifunctional uridylate/adenylate kinase n=1 Tax=Knufia fluminis TaxID=191047 RepID=A0AAN8EFX1_9EURO|nr:bifunctional uridylate/adenylate kinase [Knufia fluminis]